MEPWGCQSDTKIFQNGALGLHWGTLGGQVRQTSFRLAWRAGSVGTAGPQELVLGRLSTTRLEHAAPVKTVTADYLGAQPRKTRHRALCEQY